MPLLAGPNPNLLILDHDMLVMTGDELLSHIRREMSWDDLFVLILTEESDVGRQSHLLDTGADDFMEKSLRSAV